MPYIFQLGEIQHVLVTEVSHDKQYYVGHNKSYDQVGGIVLKTFGPVFTDK